MTTPGKARTTSVAITVIISIVTVTSLLLSGLGALLNRIASNRWREDLHVEHTIIADQLAESLRSSVWNFDSSQIGKIMESSMKNENIAGIAVRTLGRQPQLYARIRDAQWRIIPAGRDFETGTLLQEEREIRWSGEAIGTVRVLATPEFIEALLARTRVLTVVVLLPFELLLALGLYLLLWYLVLRPLHGVEAYAAAVSSGNVAGNFPVVRFQGELERLRVINRIHGLPAEAASRPSGRDGGGTHR